MRPQKHYFLVRINRKEQKEREEKIGSIYIPPTYTHMTRCMENAEIVAIGERAHEEFPEARVGDRLIIHHFIEGATDDHGNHEWLVDQDEVYNYYVVPSHEYNGERNMCYGVYNGETIIPSKDYIFLNDAPPPKPKRTIDKILDDAIKTTASGLIVFKEWKQERPDVEEEMKRLEQDNIQLASNFGNPNIDLGRLREAEQQYKENDKRIKELSKLINLKEYKPFTVAFYNRMLARDFGTHITPKDFVFVQNFASKTITEFMDKKYFVASIEYLGALYKEKAA